MAQLSLARHETSRGDGFVLPSPNQKPQRAANVVADILADAGVEVVFGLPGGAIAPVQDALLDTNIRLITTRQEAGALFAAAGYARATGKLGVVAVTSGPGVLNALTGIASAFADCIPLLVLAGEVPRSRFGAGAFQEGSSYALDIVGAVRSMTKVAVEIHDAKSAPAILERAIATAMSGRKGPVLVTVPVDVMKATIRRPLLDVRARTTFSPDPRSLAATANVLSQAKRGVIFVGSGARNGDGPKHVRALAERLGMPVMTTPKAKGVFPESHPLSLGVFGWGGHASATEYLEEGIDVMMAVGTSLGEVATDAWSSLLQPSEHFVHVDIDSQVIGRSYPTTIGLVGPVEQIVPDLALRVRPQNRSPIFGVERTDSGRTTLWGGEKRLAPQRAIWELQRALPKDTIFTSDIGEHMLFAIHHLEMDDPNGFVLMSGLGSMGSGIGAAMGVRMAHPNRTVAAICGDGCFSMVGAELATAVQERLPLLVAVMNDQRYGMVEIGHKVLYGRSPGYTTRSVDIGNLALGTGAQAQVIREPNEILSLNLAGMLQRGPLVLDIRIDRTVQLSRSRLEFLKNQSGIRSVEQE